MGDLTQLERLLGILREAGVTRFKDGGLEVELGLSLPPMALPSLAPSEPAPQPPSGPDDMQRWADELERSMGQR